MRILHVGFGFRPWIVNGLVIYCEELMHAQAQAGHEVGYFFAGRQLPLVRRPFLHRWSRPGVAMFEWLNSDLVVGRHRGTPSPEHDLAHAPTEAAFARVLQRHRPQIVHIHDLGGMPSSIAEISQLRGIPVVMTLHDYFSLCPTVKLYDVEGRVCLRRQPGAMCVACCANAPTDNREDLERTVWYARMRLRTTVPGLDGALRRPAVERLAARGMRQAERLMSRRRRGGGDGEASAVHGPPALAQRSGATGARGARGARGATGATGATGADYQHRRDGNVDRLSRLDALIAYSTRSAEIYRELGVSDERLRVLRINPGHIEHLRPKRRRQPGMPLRFAVLNACNSTPKGADLIVDALNLLSRRGLDHRYRLSVRGWTAAHVYPALAAHPSVTLDGDYRAEQLNELLEDVDVGLVPSIWEEVYGFVGVEFLAKGIPVIGSALGGIPEYVRPGETGWLNRSASAIELADLMTVAMDAPGEVQRLGARAIELRDELIRPLAAQVSDLSALYREVLSPRPAAPTPA